jgi:hypothetical protein
VHRGREIGRAIHVVNAAIGDQHRAGQLIARDIGGGLGQRGHRLGAAARTGRRVAQSGDPQLGIRQPFDRRLDMGERPVGLAPPVAHALAGGRVDKRDHHIGQRIAGFLAQDGIGQRRQDDQRGEGAPRPARQPAGQRQAKHRQRHKAEAGQRGPGQERGEIEACRHRYCPSRSSRAGTWTWSDL